MNIGYKVEARQGDKNIIEFFDRDTGESIGSYNAMTNDLNTHLTEEDPKGQLGAILDFIVKIDCFLLYTENI